MSGIYQTLFAARIGCIHPRLTCLLSTFPEIIYLNATADVTEYIVFDRPKYYLTGYDIQGMGRSLFRSHYANGEPAWIDWTVLVVLLVVALLTFIAGGKTAIVAVSVMGAVGFGVFLTASELGYLR
ncbi:hypothetical protein ACFQL1_06900 [Halomicroarcula sp. GCM10025709]